MNSYMVSLKYDFEEFQSKHWLDTYTSADISNETNAISNVDPELNFYMSNLLIIVRWIIKESKKPYTNFPQTKSLVNYLIKPAGLLPLPLYNVLQQHHEYTWLC